MARPDTSRAEGDTAVTLHPTPPSFHTRKHMLETLPQPVEFLLGAVIVALVVAGRLYIGEQYFTTDRGRIWNPIRRHVIPCLHALFQRGDGTLYAESQQTDAEFVAEVDRHWTDVRDDLLEAGYQYNPLASLATDPNGNVEKASLARYEGATLFPGAPAFLRARQNHPRLYDRSTSAGPRTAIYAHREATPWRPDLWRDHYRGESLDAQAGVEEVTDDLGLEDEAVPKATRP